MEIDAVQQTRSQKAAPLFKIAVENIVPSTLHIFLGLVSDTMKSIFEQISKATEDRLVAILESHHIRRDPRTQQPTGNHVHKLLTRPDIVQQLRDAIPEDEWDVENDDELGSIYSMNLRPRAIDFDQSWGELRVTVERILNFCAVDRKTWDYNFSDIYFMCVAVPESLGPRLYLALRDCVEEHACSILKKLQEAPPHELLALYNNDWQNFHRAALCLQNLFGYLNKQYFKQSCDETCQHPIVPQYANETKTYDVGKMILDAWKEHLLRPLSTRLTPFILNIISEDRLNSKEVDYSPSRNVLASFVEVNQSFDVSFKSHSFLENGPPTAFYEEIFEHYFLEETIAYYKYLTDQAFVELNCSEYMEKVLKKMDEEIRRGRRFVHSTTIPKIENLTSEYLVKTQMDRFQSVCGEMVRKGQKKDLKNMHKLLRPWTEGINCLISEFEKHIRSEGMEIITNTANESFQLVSQIEELHAKYLTMVKEVFDEDSDFISALDRALQNVVNYREDTKQPPKISERLNRYVDTLLRKNSKNISEAELDASLNKAITIFRYIDDKDLFQKYYSRMLASRLISHLYYSMDSEELMITKMKDACGFEFTSKLSRMFTDVGLSRTLSDRFHEHLSSNNVKLKTPVSMMVLQAGAWPLYPVTHGSGEASTSVPPIMNNTPELQESLDLFEKFYAQNHNGRKLTWLYANSHANVRLGYLDKPYLLTMNVYQLWVVLLFQNEDTVSMESVMERLSMPFALAHKFVKGFLDIAMLKTDSPTLEEISALTLNMEMTNKKLNFKVPVYQTGKPTEKQIDTTCNTLQQDRKYYMECAIVRIMKARKVMKHSALVEEVIKHTSSRFVPDVPFIKKNIEALIEKLYLQRTDQHDEYQYLA